MTSRPFADLNKRIARAVAEGRKEGGRNQAAGKRPVTKKAETETTDPDSVLFLKAMDGVKPLKGKKAGRIHRATSGTGPPASPKKDDEFEMAVKELADLVKGKKPLPVEKIPEYMDGPPINSDRRLLRRLRTGGFAVQAYCELHGLTADEALKVCDGFISDSLMSNRRCIAYIHGRGNSSPGRPVLKELVKNFLNRGRFRRYILAYCSAPAWDGGPGVTYVLLRKRPVKKRKKR